MPNEPMKSTQESVMAARKAVVMTTSTDGTDNTVPATRGIILSADLEVDVYFADDPTSAITLTLLGGLVYPFAVTAVTFGSGTCHALY